MKESTLVDKLVKAEMKELPGAVVLKHFDNVTVGVPDLSLTWGGVTIWHEVKFGRDHEVSPIQKVMLSRLGRAGHAYLVIFWPDATTVKAGEDLAVVYHSPEPYDARGVARFLRKEIERVRYY